MGRVAGKVVLVTGSARGQGAAEARLFAAEGASVVVTDVLDELGEAVAAELGGAAVYSRLDVSLEDDWRHAVGVAVEAFGRLDVLVNNAGLNLTAGLEETSAEEARRIFEVNQLGPWLGIRAVAGVMRAAGGGSIVNVGSTGAFTGLAGKSAYLTTKWAVRGLTLCAAAELGEHGIRVNAVHPGGVASEMTATVDDTAFAGQPIPRLGRPDEIAEAVLFLASDESSYCTGAEVVVDGGRLLAGPAAPYQPSTLRLPPR
jgi:3alpha(or 20beta)-hydroxysteroid dehydrogenase